MGASRNRDGSPEAPSSWAVGGYVFAAFVITLIGIFQTITGLAAIFDGDFFQPQDRYLFDLDAGIWGWIHLTFGVLLVSMGVGLFTKREWAVVGTITLAMLSAIANFFFLPLFPFWAIVLIALNVWVIWSLSRPGVEPR